MVLGVGLLLLSEAQAAECGGSGTEGITVTESSGSYTCRPNSGGFVPGVLYSHGGMGFAVGGDLQGTCEALARAESAGHRTLLTFPEDQLDFVSRNGNCFMRNSYDLWNKYNTLNRTEMERWHTTLSK